MPLDPHAAAFLRMLGGDGPPQRRPTLADRRQALRDLTAFVDPSPEQVGPVRDLMIEGPAGPLGVRLYSPRMPGSGPAPVMLFLHGGGWTTGDLDTHDGVCRRLCNGWGGKVLAVDYRLAPEHPFPAALDDAWAALTWLAGHAAALGGDAARLAVAGDSAGGGLAAALCQRAQQARWPAIALQLLICPILDPLGREPSRQAFADGYFLDQATVRSDLADYCPPGLNPADERLSPLRAKRLDGLPTALIHTAEFDPFRDEAEAYAARLGEAGVDVRLQRYSGMIHFFYALPGIVPSAGAVVEAMGARAAAMLAGPSPAVVTPTPSPRRQPAAAVRQAQG